MNKEIYVEKLDELYDSLFEFNEKPEFWRAALGSAPRYFVHTKFNGSHYFGMSKFCVLKKVTIEEYISNYRYITDGNNSQLIIKNRFNRKWIPRSGINSDIRKAFDKWILEFFPNYSIDNANFISLPEKSVISISKKIVTPEELENILDLKRKIGNIGENIAYNYEIERLKENGIKNASKYIKHVALTNTASGFDISSITRKEERFIEVKSCVSKTDQFFLTENEVLTLERLADKAYIYCVVIPDLDPLQGYVYKVIENPIKLFMEKNLLEPVMYKVKL
ncbi:hypothetical protein AMR72_00035 [Flavobacterium psychrophilum]|nr:hypothetical protein AMR72_00035 [Flavobacterium psychrophilum]AOE51045.1 hypothetical protein ALW18_00035 [Flavobacterium psychrophilum]